MKFAIVLLLLTSIVSLAACETTTTVTKECSWAEPIEFAPETKQWLSGQEWPPSAYADFNQIGDHNELHQRHC